VCIHFDETVLLITVKRGRLLFDTNAANYFFYARKKSCFLSKFRIKYSLMNKLFKGGCTMKTTFVFRVEMKKILNMNMIVQPVTLDI